MPPSLARAGARPAVRLTLAFAALAALAFGLPAVLGSPWLVGDNLIQNFPLRVLVGTDLRHGHLPLWDPYLWSGAPLLAGFNAGAAYPATALFGFLPGLLAWVLNQVLVEVVAAAGVLALLRVLGRSWLAAGLAALAFAFGGFMTAQSVHLDLVQAGAWLPWAFVAIDRLARRPAERSPLPWVALLGAALGLMILTGAVEPIFDGGIVLGLFTVWLAVRTPGRRRLHVLLGAACGVALGLLLAAVQLLPGAAFQSQSQRAMHSYTYFTSGSMNKSLTLLGLDPLLLGGGHTWPLGFIGTFTLPEVSSYIGILPVMALLGLLARRHRRSAEATDWWIWYAIVVVGLFLAWGGFTPVAHLVYDIPLFNRQRLLNRNLLEVDLALAVIFGIWVDRMFNPAHGKDGAASGSGAADGVGTANGVATPRRRWTSDVVLPLIPAAAVVALQIALAAGGPWLPRLFHVPTAVTRAQLWPLVAVLTVPSLIAVGAGVLVVRRRSFGRRLPALLVGLMLIDLVVFNAGVQTTPDPGTAVAAASGTADRLATLVDDEGQGPAGGWHRLAMFDPDRYYTVEASQLGQPDLTILRHLPSVQGYGAVVDEHYDAETGTHVQLNITPAALSGSTFTPLDLGLLLTPPEYFVHLTDRPPHFGGPIATGAVHLPPVPPDPSASPDRSNPAPSPASDYAFAAPPSPTAMVSPDTARTQYFGCVLAVTAVTIPLAAGDSGGLRVGLLSADGRRTTWLGPPQSVSGRTTVTFPAGSFRRASGLLLDATTAPVTVGAALLRTAGQGTYRVDGALRDIMTPPHWHFLGTDGPFAVFTTEQTLGRAWVDGDPGATARVVSDSAWGDETIRVRTGTSATLVRSVQFASGWQATVSGAGRQPQSVTVERQGLVQAVSVPAGATLVRFTYRPSPVYDGLALSALGILVVMGLAGGPAVVRRRRRREPPVAPG